VLGRAVWVRGTRRKYVRVATVLLEGTWPLQQTGTVVPAAGRQPLEMCPGALQAGIGPL